ncbi:MAG: histidine triad nucleotide-binding protein [Candidatus Saganbacteria bacterium]|nr:histidine triad nucleotide-binding protein [Candidatus Saganbacteria bacterium]
MAECIFCKIARKEIKSNVVFEDEDVIAFRDVTPQAPTHILVIPKEHKSSISDLCSERDHKMLAHIYNAINKIADDEGIKDSGYRVTVNSGPDAGQAVMHLHFHLMGGRKMGWPPG